MIITVNGKNMDVAEGITVHELIKGKNLDPSVVVAELNSDILPGKGFADTTLNQDDRLELLRFVGGG